MLNELRRSEIFSSNFPWRATAFATSFIILFSPFSGFVGLKVAFLTDHWNKQGAKGREGIHQTFYTHHIMLKQYSCPCFICRHSIRGLRSLCTSLFKAKMMIKRKPSLNLSSPFHLCKSKGQIYLLSDRLFLLTFRRFLLKMGAKGEGKRTVFLTFSKSLVFLHTHPQNCVLFAGLLNETGMVGRLGSCKEEEKIREVNSKENCSKGGTVMEQKGLTKSTSRPRVTVI